MTETVVRIEAGNLSLPLNASDVASVSIIGTDIIVVSKSGNTYFLLDAAFEALTVSPPAIVFADGTSVSSYELVQGVLEQVSIDSIIRLPSALPAPDEATKTEEEEKEEDESGEAADAEQQEAQPEKEEGEETETSSSAATSAQTVSQVSGGVELSSEARPVTESSERPMELASVSESSDPAEFEDVQSALTASLMAISKASERVQSPTPQETELSISSVSANVTVAEDTLLTFAGSNALSISFTGPALGNVTAIVQATAGIFSAPAGGASVIGSGTRAIRIEGSLAEVNASLASLTFLPPTNFNGVDSIVLSVSDGSTRTSSRNLVVNVTAVNDAPENTVPLEQRVSQITILRFEEASGNAIRVGDTLDTGFGGTDRLSTVLTVAVGSLEARELAAGAPGAGATILGNRSNTVTIEGTAAQVNAALEGLIYRPLPSHIGRVELTVTTSDLGNTGAGGVLIDSDLIMISVETDETDVQGIGDDTFVIEPGFASANLVGGEADEVRGDRLDARALIENVTVTMGTSESGILQGAAQQIVFTEMEQVLLGFGNDAFFGGAGADVVFGGAGNDTLQGGAGDDTFGLHVDFGMDTVLGGETGETLCDLLDAHALMESVTVTFSGAEAGTLSGESGTVSFSEIERLSLGAGDDIVTGAEGNESVDGGAGQDSLSGGGGNDTLMGGAGTDTLYGEAGDDHLGGGTGADTLIGGEGRDTLLGGDENDALDGGLGDDVLDGGTGHDRLLGGEGNDSLSGNFGDDRVEGGDGNDTLAGGSGNDTLHGDGGDDLVLLVGSFGLDTVLGGEADESTGDVLDAGALSEALTVTFSGVETGVLNGVSGRVDFSEIERLVLGSGNDSIFGGSGAEYVESGAGDDRLLGGGGNDTLFGGAGDDQFVLASGFRDDSLVGGEDGQTNGDLLDASAVSEGLNVTFSDSEIGLLVGASGTVSFSQIERIALGSGNDSFSGAAGSENVFGGAGADTLLGDSGNDTLSGGAGNDSIEGGAGDDVLAGDEGDDTILGGDGDDRFALSNGFGSDVITGGDGSETFGDLLDASGVSEGLTVTFDGPKAGTVVFGSDTVNFSQIERLRLGAGGDIVFGGSAADSVDGGAGNDSLYGGGENDTLQGGAGDDQVDGGAGDDSLAGDAGNDTLIGGAGADTLEGGLGDDSLSGGAGNDALFGGQGSDTIDGGADADTIFGGVGNDSLLGGDGDDTFVIESGFGNDTLVGGEAGELDGDLLDASGLTEALSVTFTGPEAGTLTGVSGTVTFSEIERLHLGGGNDSVFGGVGAEHVFGGLGDDSLAGDSGNDKLFGGSGADRVDGGSGNDSLLGEEGEDTLFGGDGADTLDGGIGNDSLSGGAGNDSLRGGDGDDRFVLAVGFGNDTLVGGDSAEATGDLLDASGLSEAVTVSFTGSAQGTLTGVSGTVTFSEIERLQLGTGDDALIGNSGAEHVDGGAGNDSLAGGAGSDTLLGAAGNDSLDGGEGDDSLFGGLGNDTILGGAGSDRLEGGDGNDSLSGLAGNDTLLGGQGDDTLSGGDNADSLEGGAGNDSLGGEGGDDTLLGGVGADQLDAGSGNDTVMGESGNDSLFGGAGADFLDGGTANDFLSGDSGNDTLLGDVGDDSLDGGVGNDSLSGGAGNDTLIGAGGNDTLFGDAGDDRFAVSLGFGVDSFFGGESGEVSGDIIDASSFVDPLTVIFTGDETGTISPGTGQVASFAGIERIVLGGGNDSLLGGSGAESVDGGAGNDSLAGGTGNDSLAGGQGDDTLIGGAGDDRFILSAGFGADSVDGGEAAEISGDLLDASGVSEGLTLTITGSESGTLVGSSGTVAFSGVERFALGSGNDVFDGTGSTTSANVDAGAGNDSLTGSNKSDTLIGGLGRDTLYGGLGNDELVLDAGDLAFGGDGSDTFLIPGITSGDSTIVVYGGDTNDSLGDGDVLDLQNLGPVTITYKDGNPETKEGTVTFTNPALAHLTVQFFGIEQILAQEVNVVDGLGVAELMAPGYKDDQGDEIDGADGLNDTIRGNDGNDTIYGGFGDDVITGGAGNDVISGDAGSDTVLGGLGDDRFILTNGFGSDRVTGGETGEAFGDVLDASGLTDALTLTLTGSEAGTLTGLPGTADFFQIERFLLGSGQDSFFGGAGMEYVEAGAGNDSLSGGAGNDTLFGGAGDDRFVLANGFGSDSLVGGEAGQTSGDLIDASAVTQALTLSFTSPETGTISGGGNTLAFGEIERFVLGSGNDSVFGGVGADSVDAGAGNDSLLGGDGNDSLLGGSGADTLFGDESDDHVEGGSGNDSLSGDAGNDTLFGGEGDDRFVIAGNFGADTVFGGASGETSGDLLDAGALVEAVTLQFSGAKAGTLSVSSGTVSFSEVERVLLGSGDDTVIGGSGADNVDGGGGNDSLSGGDGTDSLSGGTGNDTLLGAAGSDSLSGGDGDDLFFGGPGNDTMSGGAGDDRFMLAAGFGSDSIIGGGGAETVGDLIDASEIEEALTLTITAAGTGTLSGSAGTAQFSQIERFFLGSGNDTLLGSAGSDAVDGGIGDDSLTGGAGADVFIISSGTDIITDLGGIDALADVLIVANGAHVNARLGAHWTATASTTKHGTGIIDARGFNINVSAASGTRGWTLTNSIGAVVALTGSLFADVLSGNSGGDTLSGGGGNDTLNGGAGVNLLTGGDGDDLFVVTAGVNTITDLNAGGDIVTVSSGATANATLAAAWTATAASSNAGTATITVGGFGANLSAAAGANGWTLTNATNATAVMLTGSNQNDTLIGGAGNDTLLGGLGNDNLTGGAGDDSLTGGAGQDTFNVDSGTDTITDLGGNDIVTVSSGATANATLAAAWTATAASSNAGTATITVGGFGANLSAAAGANGWTLTNATNATAVTLTGSIRNDTLIGGMGNDTLVGGSGNDSLTGGAGIDTFTVAIGTDAIIDLGAGGDVVTVSSGATANATLVAAWTATAASSNAGTATITANGFNADLTSASGTNGWTLTNAGNATAVTLTGSIRNDTLIGGLGNDTLAGGSGNDSLTGGAGIDTFTVAIGTDAITDLGAGGDVVTVSSGATATATLAAAWTATAASSNAGVATITVNGFGADISAATGANGWTLSNTGNGTSVSLTGSAQADTLIGGTGSDTLIGGAGNDRLFVISGSDSLDGGAGSDTADFSRLTVGVTVTLDPSGSATVVAGAATVTLNGIENLVGSGGADILTGNEQDNVLTGGAGNDSLYGGAGNDLLVLGMNFTPLDLPGLALWLDGADLDGDGVQEGLAESGLNGSSIAHWNDKSGNGRHASQTTVAAQPTYASGGVGGVSFSANDFLALPSVLPAGATSASVFFVSRTTSSSSGGSIIGTGWGAGSTDNHLPYNGGSIFDGTFSSARISNVSYSGSLIASLRMMSIEHSASQYTFSIDGSATFNTGASFSSPSGTAWLGRSNTQYWNGVAADIIVVSTVLSTADRQRLEGYLAWKWGTSGVLPNNHPFKLGSNILLDGGQGVDTADLSVFSHNLSVALDANGAATFVAGGATVTLNEVENILAGRGNDKLTGNGLANNLSGGVGNDTLTGGAGNDTLTGGSGNDVFAVDAGSDTIMDFGVGADVVTVSGGASVSFSLGASWTATSASSNNGTATINANGFDVNVSAATGSGGWILTNASSMQGVSLTGAAGSDTLIGGGGNDRLFVTAGSDSLDGGGGSDTADFSRLSVGVSVTLDASGSATVVAGAATVTLNGIENLVGGGGADILTGNEQDNVITGGAGNDSLFGGAGNDLLAVQGLFRPLDLPGLSFWLDGADLDGDGVQEGLAESGLNGTAVTQWNDKSGNGRHAVQTEAASRPTYTANGLNGLPVVSFDGTDILNTPSFILGNTVATVARRSATNQPVVEGGNVGSQDRGLWGLRSGSTDFTTHLNYGINGGPLNATNADGFPINVPQIVSQTAAKGAVATTASIWGIGGGASGYVRLNGFISEMVATSSLLSTADRERLEGYLAWKWGTVASLPDLHPYKFINPIASAVLLDGGAGSDTADLSALISNLSVALDAYGAATFAAAGATFTLNEIENILAGSGNDSLTGNDLANNLSGGAGNDTLTGGAGNDTLIGDAGNDSLSGGAGNDTLNGGAGNDTLFGNDGDDRFVLVSGFGTDSVFGGEGGETSGDVLDASALTTAVTVSFTGPEAGTIVGGGTVTFSEVERILLGSGNDTLTGGSGAENVDGGLGNDSLSGGAGHDTLLGGAGDDTLLGNDGDDRFVLVSGFGTDSVFGGEGGETSGDVLDASALTAAVTVSFTGPEAGTLVGGGTVTFSEVESILLGSGNDTVMGGSGAENVDGGLGHDSLSGGAGHDTLLGGEGNDTLLGGGGADMLFGGAGNDRFEITAGQLSEIGAGSVDGGSGFDTLKVTGMTGAPFDLSSLINGGSTMTNGIEVLDLSNGTASDQTVSASLASILALDDDGTRPLILRLDTGDTLNIVGTSGYSPTFQTSQTVDGFTGTLYTFTPDTPGETIQFLLSTS
jgi:Ca2+-binding RTX toxin-like protein